MSLRRKSLVYSFSLIVAGATVFSVLALYATFSYLLEKQYRATDIEKAVSIGYVVDAYVSNEIRRLSSLSATLKQDQRILSIIRAGTKSSGSASANSQQTKVGQPLAEVIGTLDLSSMAIFGPVGELLFQHGDAPVRVPEPVDRPASTADQITVQKLGADNAIVYASAVVENGKSLGTILLAAKLDTGFVARIANDTFAAISLVAPDGTVVSSAKSGNDPAAMKLAAAEAQKSRQPVQIHDDIRHMSQIYIATKIVDWPYVAVIGVQSETALELLGRARTATIWIALGVLLIAVGIGGSYVYVSLRPLRALQKRAEQVVASHSSQTPPTAIGDEVEELVHRFDWMTDNLLARARELEAARVAAQQANNSKSAFLASMSHEIRTPMNGVIGMTSLLADSPLTAEQREYVDTIRLSGSALLRIINDILDFSKIESGKMELEEQPFELARCIEEAFGMVAPTAQKKKLDLLYLIENDVPPWINGDVTRLRQVLVNLVGNSVKFTEHGEVVVEVSRHNSEPGSMALLIAVKDSGIGIPDDKQATLFQPFYQVDSSTARKYGGSGLGLAICARLVDLMGGNIAVSSEAGKGSTFSFSIRTKAMPPMRVRYSQTDRFLIRNKRVLIVDDNHTGLHILSTVVRGWGLECEIAATPSYALTRLASDTHFDCAILDYHMPEMDGIELARAIRGVRHRATLPLILFSSADVSGAAIKGNKGLFAGRLMKPLRQSQMFDVLLATIGGGVAPEVTAATAATAPVMRSSSRIKVLLAEDNAINVQLATTILAKLGYAADLAGNGIEAVEATRRQRYDIILMDVQMPEMDGIEATREIRLQGTPESQPFIIALTANIMEEDRRRYEEAGMNAFLAKPYTSTELSAVLDEASKTLSSRRAKAGASAGAVNTEARAAPGGLLDRKRAQEVLDHLCEVKPDAFDDWIKRLEGELANFAELMRRVAAETHSGADTEVTNTKIQFDAHSLKGMTLVMGAQALGERFAEIERDAKAGQSAVVTKRYHDSLELETQSVQALKEFSTTHRANRRGEKS